MSAIDAVLKANEEYARNFKLGDLPIPPARHLAIVACMDARLTVEKFGGLDTGDAHIIRNAGGVVTDDAVRSLLISHHLLGTKEWMIVEHTDCGMLTFKDEDLLQRLEKQTGTAVHAPSHFHAFQDLETNVRRQIQKLRAHPWVPKEISVRGFVYDVRTGKLREITG
ncbi:MAG TPA: carbonic anhydrase [Candidatus Binataceae bacterium]|jgi:carbonic anhydrase|nr:carbonic anhydrase [Candidatus Binataceae bacterium]